ncbi:sigma-70 family RNA polymerase sigma factor [Nocardioides currus]|nr:sigma-70 family RNA polymerase sigma factor [Nocardioides currus]
MTVHTLTSTDESAVISRHERSRRTSDLFADAARARDDEHRHEMHEQIMVLNIGVAHAVAHRFTNRGVDVQDLEQVACEALMKAVQRFDHTRDHDFLSFAVPTIRGELQRHFRDLGWMVRPTRRVQETQWQAARTEEHLTSDLGRTPTGEEVIAALGISREEYAEAQSAHGCFVPASLDQPLAPGEDGADLGSTLTAAESDLDAAEARVILAPRARELSERERLVLYLRYFEDLTQVEIGHEIGVGQAQVSRILNSALATMRDGLTGTDAA